MKICYRPKTFTPAHTLIIEQANGILKELADEGYSVTLRQLYYQFVSRDIIPNTLQSYKRLGDILNEARMAGELSWESMEDRTRNVQVWQFFDSPKDCVEEAARTYDIDWWNNQPRRVLIMYEKEALTGIVERVAGQLRVPCIACRGYMSQSEQWSVAQRLMDWRDKGQDPFVIHLGDHDPSGIDMTRDNLDRLSLFSEIEDLEVERIALNMDQIRRYRPPPNPAKMTDARAEGYVREFGTSSWELDALSPKIISDLVEQAVMSVRDEDQWSIMNTRYREERATLRRIVNELDTGAED